MKILTLCLVLTALAAPVQAQRFGAPQRMASARGGAPAPSPRAMRRPTVYSFYLDQRR